MPLMTRDEILDCLKTHRDELRHTYGVEDIALFGSYARESAHDGSDIDIAVELSDKKKTLTNFFCLKAYLEDRLGRRVDLGIESAIKPIVKMAAQKDMLHV